MSMEKDPDNMDFEERLRQTLRQSAEGCPARVRSRLTQARQAALEAAQKPRRSLWAPGLWPALGALTAALLVALIITYPAPRPPVQVATERPTVEDLDLLADSEGMDLVQSDDGDFYEWAMQQAEGTEASPVPGNGV
jgi:hypothetical protein